MYRILIVEDTPAEADALRAHLARFSSERDVPLDVQVIPGAFVFVGARHQADLIFMDIDMPGVNGIEAAEELRTYDDQVPLVFVTNLAQYAVRGYAVDALDFLVKPVTYEAFAPCMDRALRAMRRREGSTVTIPSPEGLRVVSRGEVLFVDILRHDLHYHLADGSVLRVRGSIRAAEGELGEGFVKVSASCLANMAQVRLVRQGSVVLTDNTELFFSRGCRKAALETLANYVGRSV